MTAHTNDIDISIIGAGVVGLAVAAELSKKYHRIFVFERNRSFGLETSSHNSEVIHAGIYYPQQSLKARFCVEGNPLLHEICRKYDIPHKNTGKIIIAADAGEEKEIERLYQQGIKNGLTDLSLLSGADVKRLEPKVKATMGLLSPSTGILDAFSLMRFFEGFARQNGADIVYNAEVVGIERNLNGYKLLVNQNNTLTTVTCCIVINCAGLYCDKVAALAGIDIAKSDYKIKYCKGEYFTLDPRVGHLTDRLIYPVPEQAGKGIHISVNLEGHMKLGPNVKWVDKIDYSVDASDQMNFYQAASRYLPAINFEDLSPDFAGVRPKLQGPGEGFRDFVIRDEADKGLPGFINLIGIESPGLTSSPAIARYVAELL